MQDGVCDEDRQLRRLRLQPPVAERMHNLFQLLTVLLKVAKLDLTAPVRETLQMKEPLLNYLAHDSYSS